MNAAAAPCTAAFALSKSKITMRLIPLCHELLRARLQAGDHVIDATAGGGHDTLFLAQCVGASGRVSSFDIQQQALDDTRRLLDAHEVDTRVDLHLHSHDQMRYHLPLGVPVSAVMFNLGYLPGGDHSVVTRPDTSLRALQIALELVKPLGLVTVMIYPSHPGGREEYEQLGSYLETLPQREYTVMQLRCFNAAASAPQLWCIEKQVV